MDQYTGLRTQMRNNKNWDKMVMNTASTLYVEYRIHEMSPNNKDGKSKKL